MTALRRRAAASVLLGFGLVLAACTGGAPATPAPSASRSSATTSSHAPSPAGPGGSSPAASLPPTSTTEFGRIWDALPSSFPSLPGQTESEVGTATSGMFAVKGNAAVLAIALRSALTRAGWTVDVGSPLEDGTVVLDATHAPAGCRTEVRLRPESGTVSMSVLYGAACPFS